MAEGLLSRFMSRPGQAEALMNMGAQLMAAGAPTTDPGASARGWGTAGMGYTGALADARRAQEAEELRKIQLDRAKAEAEKERRAQEGRDALSRTLLGSRMGGQGPAAGSFRGAQEAGLTDPGALASFQGPQGALLRGIAAADPGLAARQALELSTKETKAPGTREVKKGDEVVTEQWDPATGQYKEIARARRYKPQEGAEYKPLTPSAKLLADREHLTKKLMLPETHPNVRAIDRELTKLGVPSGESARTQEQVVSGKRTLEDITKTLMPDEKVDMNAVTSMWANLPKTQGKTTSAQFDEAAGLLLRLETGAAQTDAEVANVVKRYKPNPLDSAATIKDKLERFRRRFENAKAIFEGREGGEAEQPRIRKTPGGIEYEVLQ